MTLEQLLAMGLNQEQAEKILAEQKAELEKTQNTILQAKQAELDAIKANRDEILKEKKALKDKQDAEQAEKDKLEQEKAKSKGDIEKLEAQYKAEIAKRDQQIADMVKADNDKLLSSTAKDIARSLATSDTTADLLQQLITNRLTVDDLGNVKVLGQDGQLSILTLDDFKNEIKSCGRFDALIVGTNASGVGSQGQGSAGTKKLTDYTEAELVSLQKSNPAEFDRIVNLT